MASQDHIRNPIEWGWDQIALAALTVGSLGRSLGGSEESQNAPPLGVCRIEVADLKDVLIKGLDDFGEYRTDVIFLCLIYPLVGISLAWLTFGNESLPLLFPLASGFALVGSVAAVGLYEMSRRREQGIPITWADAFGAIRSPGFGAILVLGLALLGIFLLWLLATHVIYDVTLGPEPPVSIAAFARDVFTTRDVDPRCGCEPGPDGSLGLDCRRRLSDRVDTCISWSHFRHARARARHLALVPQGGGAEHIAISAHQCSQLNASA